MVVAIIVTYFPNIFSLELLLRRLLPQTSSIFIVDNTPGEDNSTLTSLLDSQDHANDFKLIRLKQNYGIAYALNIGIKEALATGANFILLSDQDSLPASNMVNELCIAHEFLRRQGVKIGAIGPTYTNAHTSNPTSFQVFSPKRLFYIKQTPTTQRPLLEVLTLITSGTLISAKSINQIGLMREDFFIDHVDNEWCHRARSKGYRLYGAFMANMDHSLGETPLNVWFGRWKQRSKHSPVRVYYQIRNFIQLCKLDYVDLRWKIRSAWYSLGIAYAHILFSNGQKSTYLCMVFKGVWHGITSKMGAYR